MRLEIEKAVDHDVAETNDRAVLAGSVARADYRAEPVVERELTAVREAEVQPLEWLDLNPDLGVADRGELGEERVLDPR